MGFFVDFLKNLFFAFIFILINTIVLIVIAILVIYKKKRDNLDENKSIEISSLDKVINFRDIIVNVFVFGMVIYLIFQVFIFISNYTNVFGI